ncbi:MAG: ParA family protein [Spartobacteria bacterium]|nr:ParA family protein [Spartobacteria bacterium]
MTTRIIAVANQKGGVGKTTTTVNLAACLTVRKQHILLVDLDPQANATSGIGVEPREGASVYSPLLGEAALEDFIIPTEYRRLDLVPAELDLAGAEVDIARMDNYLHRLRDALRPLVESNRYDYIMLDCPPSLGIITMNAMTAADGLLIPIQCEYFALEGLSIMVRLIRQLRESGANPHLAIDGIIMTMYDGRTNLAQQVVHEVVTHFSHLVYETLIPRTVRLSEAPSYGQPIIVYDRNCTGAVAYLKLAQEFIQRNKQRVADEANPPQEPPASDEQPLSEEPSPPPAEPSQIAEEQPAPEEQPPPEEHTP